MRQILLLAIFPLCAAAQTPSQPPTLIRLIRNGSIKPYSSTRAPVTLFGMKSISGFHETWIMEAHDSFAGIENLDKIIGSVLEDEASAPSRTMIALYRPGLSYRPDQASRMYPKARYFQVSIYRISPGADGDFAELVRLRRQSLDSLNLNRPDVAYQVISGAESGTYVFLGPLVSLSTLDSGLASSPIYADGVVDASMEARRKIAADGQMSRENLLFRIDPGISNVSDEFAAEESEFWHGKKKP